jgi:tRNA threonylcarbamoyladenosine biosynthesis protein TsaE
MKRFGSEIAQSYSIVLLEGGLGAWKTTFAKGFAEGLGINSEQVQSPTYTYINVYDNKLLHVDLYRLEHFGDLVEKGILDQMENYDYILIERPKWIEKLWIFNALHLHITKFWENEREVIKKSDS